MTRYEASARLALNADEAWRKIGDFGAVGEWHPLLKSVESEGNAPGDLRLAEGGDGSRQVERLTHYNTDAQCYRYEMVETALPVRNYTSEFRIDPTENESCVVRWSAEFEITQEDEKAGESMISGFLEAGTDALEKLHGSTEDRL
tara:strand:- start:962 stop:1396 length:435 start_codon:yes stop_codon:yes gene_type:complete